MATFSGDVQYSQNGTVTNPCLVGNGWVAGGRTTGAMIHLFGLQLPAAGVMGPVMGPKAPPCGSMLRRTTAKEFEYL